MHHEHTAPTDIDLPRTSLWAKLPLIGGVLAVVGLGATLAMALGEHRERAMFSYLWAFYACLSIALGAWAWVMIEHLARSGWSAAIRRVGETAAVTLPLFALLWIPIATLGYHSLYPWSHETDAILEKKRWFLGDGFFFGRAIFYFALWSVFSYLLYRWSTRQDSEPSLEGRTALTHKMWRLSAPGILLFALTSSFAAIDWLMSLQPHWYSTIFGVYLFARSILSFYAFTILVVMGLQKAGVLKSVTAEHFHDLGKYTFGFTVFWAYIAFSQFVLIWYANIPEETEFYLVRMHGGWQWISYALPILNFALPFFFLLSRQIKRRRVLLAVAAIWTLLVHLVDLYWLILPNYGMHHGGGHAEPHLAVSWMDFAALFGMVGVFLAVFSFLLARKKVMAVNDPRIFESLAHENY
ncbi:MAG: hypothetical protein M3Y59_17500 [Myxococcota bacterium]|nr:hypothetical protein [Myxococcota bacterium]